MKNVQLGSSKLHVTPICLGTMTFGEQVQEAEAHAILDRSLERGVNFIDTAEMYAVPAKAETCGATETIIGNWFAQRPGARDKLVLATKVAGPARGMPWMRDEMTKAGIIEACEGSLRRLQTDVIDLYQIHWPSRAPTYDDSGIEEAWSTLADLKRQGKVRAIGVSNFDVGQLERVAAIAPVESLQPPYSALMRQIEDQILPYCRRHAIGVIAYSPMHHGMLSGRMSRGRIAAMPESDWRKRHSPAFSESHLTPSLRFVDVLRGIADRHGRSVADVAVAWVLRHPAVTGAIVGARSAAQVDGFVGAMGLSLGDDDLGEIEAALPASVSLL